MVGNSGSYQPQTLTINGASTYGGDTTLSGGSASQPITIAAGVTNALPFGAGKGNLCLNNNGAFSVNGKTVNINGLNGTAFGAVNGGGTLILGNGDAGGSFTGIVSSALALIKTGNGTQSLSGTNTYSGATTIGSGTLEIGGAGQLRSGNYAGAITNNGTLVWASSADQTLSGDMAGTGSLIKTNSGTLTLVGANTYSGDTTILQGTLDAVSLGASTVIAVSNSATLIIRSDSTIASDAMVSLDLSAQMNLSNTGTNTVYSLTIGGVPQCRGVWGASGSGANFTCSQFVTGHNGMLRVVNGPDQGTVYKIR
jgi:autotransporter-associated beta strand protein